VLIVLAGILLEMEWVCSGDLRQKSGGEGVILLCAVDEYGDCTYIQRICCIFKLEIASLCSTRYDTVA